MSCATVRRELRKRGLLLMQDKQLPSVVGIIAGEPLASSWWSHPKAQEIFACLESLTDDPDVLTTRLIGGKVTYLDRALHRPFVALATSKEAWQTRGISAAARALLRNVPTMATGPASRELQDRLLVRAEEVHTKSGKHETRLSVWPEIMMDVEAARRKLEDATEAIGASVKALPWRRFGGGR